MRILALVLAALFLPLAAVPASAEPLMASNCRLDLRFMQTGGGIYAVVQVDAIWGALIDGELTLMANGQEVKVEPVLTNTQMVSVTWIAPAGATVQACAWILGDNWITNELRLPASQERCGYVSSETSNLANRRAPLRQTREPLPADQGARPRR